MRYTNSKLTKLKTIVLASLALTILVAAIGCSSEPAEEQVTNESVVLYVKDDSALFADIDTEAVYFPYIPEDALFSQDGQNISVSDLKPGDLVKVTGNGAMAESYPAQYPGITKIEVTGFDDSYVSQYDYIISRVFADADPNEVPTAYAEYDVEDVGNITVALESYSYEIETPNGPISADGSVTDEDGVVLEGVPDMVISDTNFATIGFSSELTGASVTCIPTTDIEGTGIVADSSDEYSVMFELDDSSISLEVAPGNLYTVIANFSSGQAAYSFLVK